MTREIGITRAHLEEDAGKSIHEGFSGFTAIDLNRAGAPLIEDRFRAGFAYCRGSGRVHEKNPLPGSLPGDL